MKINFFTSDHMVLKQRSQQTSILVIAQQYLQNITTSSFSPLCPLQYVGGCATDWDKQLVSCYLAYTLQLS